MAAIIETRNLTKIYGGKVKALDDLNISIEEGEVYGLLGPNGAGKTTTINLLVTRIAPTSGTAIVNGFDIVKNSLEVRKSIGVVPQDLTTDEDLGIVHQSCYELKTLSHSTRVLPHKPVLNIIQTYH